MKILVTGAAGFIGREFCALAGAQGHVLRRVLRRTAEVLAGEVVVADLEAGPDLAGAMAGVDVANPEQAFWRANVEVARRLVKQVAVLHRCRRHLNPDGLIIASMPNVTHLAVRAMLLSGAWDYARTGIMDDSHLRFFSRSAVLALFSAAGLAVGKLEATTLNCRAIARLYGLRVSAWFRGMAWLVATDSTWRDFQYVVAARPVADAAQAAAINVRHQMGCGLAGAWSFKVRTLFQDMALLSKVAIRGVCK